MPTTTDCAKPKQLMMASWENSTLLLQKTLTATEAPNLDTKSLITKLGEVAKTVDLDVPTILAEQTKDPVFGTVRSWLCKGI